MRTLTTLSALAATLTTAIVLASAGVASATTLCTTAACTVTYPGGSPFDGVLRAGSLATIVTTGGTLRIGTISCNRANFTLESTNGGGANLDVSALLTAFGLDGCAGENNSNCDAAATVQNLRDSAFVTDAGGGNGNLDSRQPAISFRCGPAGSQVTCSFGGGVLRIFGTITGGATATVAMTATLRINGAVADCPRTASLAVSFSLTGASGHPTALFVGP